MIEKDLGVTVGSHRKVMAWCQISKGGALAGTWGQGTMSESQPLSSEHKSGTL